MKKNRVAIIEFESKDSEFYNNAFKNLNFNNIYFINNTSHLISNLRILDPDFIVFDTGKIDEATSSKMLQLMLDYMKSIPLVVVSSKHAPYIVNKLKMFSSSEIFLKPFNLNKFSSLVESLLNKNIIKGKPYHKIPVFAEAKAFMLHFMLNIF